MVCCCELLWRQGKQIFESAPSLHCWYCNKVAACRFLKQDWKPFKSLFKLVSLVTCFANYQVGLLDRLGHKPDSPAGKVQLSLQEVIHHLLYLGHFLLKKLDMDEFSEMSYFFAMQFIGKMLLKILKHKKCKKLKFE